MARGQRKSAKIDPEIIDQTIQEEVRNQLQDEFSEYAVPDEDDGEYYDEEESDIDEEIQSRDAFDIFDGIINPRLIRGDAAKWELQRNGDTIGTFYDEASWDDVQKEHGGGRFKVIAKDSKGKYITSQTKKLAPPKVKEKESEKADTAIANVLETMMEMTNKQSERFERLLEKTNRDKTQEASSTTQLVTTVLQSVLARPEPKGNDNMEMMKFMMEMQDKANARMEKVIETMGNNLRETIASLKSDDSAPDPLETYQQIRDAEEKAEERMHKYYERLEKQRKDLEDEFKTKDSGKSTVDKLIESMMPAMPGLLTLAANSKKTSPAPQGQRRIAANPQAQGQVAPKPKQGHFKPNSAPRNDVEVQGTRPVPVKPAAKPVNRGAGAASLLFSLDDAMVDETSPTATPSKNAAPITMDDLMGTDEAEIVETAPTVQENSTTVTISDGERSQIEVGIAASLNVIGAALLSEREAAETGVECAHILFANTRVSPQVLQQEVSLNGFHDMAEQSGILAMAKDQGKEDHLLQWLETLHATIQQEYARLLTSQEVGEASHG